MSSKLLSCSSSLLTPVLSRATTNNRCVVNTKFTITYTPVILGNQRVLIPCLLINYLPEIKVLLQTQSLKQTIIDLSKKYNLPLMQEQNIKRYTYPTVNGRIPVQIIQFNSTFKLLKTIDSIPSSTPDVSLDYIITNKTYIVGICNDDTKTFSYTYTDMVKYASYLLSTLNIDIVSNPGVFCVTCNTNDSNLVKTIPGYIRYLNNQLIFTPILSKLLLPRYIPYDENTDITILYTGSNLIDTINYNKETYHKNTVDSYKCVK